MESGCEEDGILDKTRDGVSMEMDRGRQQVLWSEGPGATGPNPQLRKVSVGGQCSRNGSGAQPSTKGVLDTTRHTKTCS